MSADGQDGPRDETARGGIGRAPPQGFHKTLVLRLIAVFLLVVALAMLFPIIGGSRGPRPRVQSQTRTLQKSLETACEAYHLDFGAYPPDEIVAQGIRLKSSEALLHFLTTAFRKHPQAKEVQASEDYGPYIDVSQIPLKDLDDNGAPEIIDEWGQAILYDEASNGFHRQGPSDPRKDGSMGNPNGFDLLSPGDSTHAPVANFKLEH
ncbi:MAG: hypothetical protein KIS92_00275 [Planctomycetota bacterium]|nr:hypothetical protein [Planctomycetota bacterium]